MEENVRRKIESRERGATNLTLVWVLLALALGFVVGMLVFQRPAKTQDDTSSLPAATTTNGVAADPNAKPVKISAGNATNTLIVDPRKGPTLNISQNHTIQWQNTTDEQLLLVFNGAPIGQVIERKDFGKTLSVCRTCTTTKYPYRIYRWDRANGWVQMIVQEDGGPTEPEIDVAG